MNKIICPYKQSFYTADKSIRIYDERLQEFYFYDVDLNKDVQFFNLPKGEYYTGNNIYLLKENQFYYNEIDMPPPENDAYLYVKKVYIKPSTNDRKASIFIDKENGYSTIIYDKKLDLLPYYCKDFVIGHELGHLKYISEDVCDRYSRNLLTKLGYNPSQLNKAVKQTLEFRSSEATHRIEISKNDNKNYKPLFV